MHSKGSVDFALLVSGRHILTLNILLFYKNIYIQYIYGLYGLIKGLDRGIPSGWKAVKAISE